MCPAGKARFFRAANKILRRVRMDVGSTENGCSLVLYRFVPRRTCRFELPGNFAAICPVCLASGRGQPSKVLGGDAQVAVTPEAAWE